MKLDEILVVIPARGGSKGVPDKNIKLLNGKPLIQYALEFAGSIFNPAQICVSTDSKAIIELVEGLGIPVPFIRPDVIATDEASMRDVLLHAITYYKEQGKQYKYLLLLQPTSPFRMLEDWTQIKEIAQQTADFDMIVSVKESHANPYFNLFEESKEGFLSLSKKADFVRRQDCPKIYEYNGAFYLINIQSLEKSALSQLEKIVKYIMPQERSVDIDTIADWEQAEKMMGQEG